MAYRKLGIRCRCLRGKRERSLARKKFRMVMQEDLMSKAPGMSFAFVLKNQMKATPRVIHALGNLASFPRGQ